LQTTVQERKCSQVNTVAASTLIEVLSRARRRVSNVPQTREGLAVPNWDELTGSIELDTSVAGFLNFPVLRLVKASWFGHRFLESEQVVRCCQRYHHAL